MANFKTGAFWTDIKAYRNAYILTIIASFGGMLFGWDTGLIGGVLTMESFQVSFGVSTVTVEEAKAYSNLSGNIVSVLQAGCFFGAMASFCISDRFGRKTALIFGGIVFLLGCILQTCSGIESRSLGLLYVGRAVGGFGVGLISAVVPTYIGENCDKEIRGRCIGCMQLFNVTGIMISYFVNYGVSSSSVAGTSLQWRIPFALQTIPGVLLVAGLITQGESPRWLVEKERRDLAHQALARVRGKASDDRDVLLEFEEIVADFEGREKLSLWQQQWTGTNSINYYSPQIFASIGIKGTQAGLFATGIYGVVKTVITALGLMFATEQVGRKYSLMVGAIGQAFAMFYIGVHTALSSSTTEQTLTGSGYFAIVCVYLFVVFYSFGWGPVPFVLSAEYSPNHVRSFIMALALMCQWLFNFVIARTVPVMLANITYGTFILFGVCSIFCFLFATICVPETAGMPLESVHLLFGGNIIKDALLDNIPSHCRARKWVSEAHMDKNVEAAGGDDRKKHVEHAECDGVARALD